MKQGATHLDGSGWAEGSVWARRRCVLSLLSLALDLRHHSFGLGQVLPPLLDAFPAEVDRVQEEHYVHQTPAPRQASHFRIAEGRLASSTVCRKVSLRDALPWRAPVTLPGLEPDTGVGEVKEDYPLLEEIEVPESLLPLSPHRPLGRVIASAPSASVVAPQWCHPAVVTVVPSWLYAPLWIAGNIPLSCEDMR